MKKILHRCMAVALSLFLVFQVFPTGVLAEESDFTDTTLSDTSREEEETFDSETEWEETGMLNADGTPVTADQGDTPEPLGEVQSLSNEPSVQPASYTLTLDLDGGQVNTMDNFGWSQSSYEIYKWMRTVTETEAGQGVLLTLDSTLGGLLPGQPYRAGYIFTGWKIGDTEYGANDNRSVTITEDATVDAQWQIATYNVSFQGNDGELWSVEVPYGAALWTDDYAPWTEDTVSWADDNTAAVSVTFNGAAENITVTRHPDELNNQQYYYTFILEGVYYFTYGGSTPTKNGQYFTGWKLMYGGSGFTVTDDAAFSAQFQMKKSHVTPSV